MRRNAARWLAFFDEGRAFPLDAADRPVLEVAMKQCRERLGVRFEKAYEAGLGMERAQLVTEVRAWFARQEPAAMPEAPARLSPREVEILRLVAAGEATRPLRTVWCSAGGPWRTTWRTPTPRLARATASKPSASRFSMGSRLPSWRRIARTTRREPVSLHIDPAVFRPEAIAPETAAFNAQVEAQLATITPSWQRVPQDVRDERESGKAARLAP